MALRAHLADFDRRLEARQMVIVDPRQWYLAGGRFDGDRVTRRWVDTLNDALARGYEGMRVTAGMDWLDKANWPDVARYESAVNSLIGYLKAIAICQYPLSNHGDFEVADVVRTHPYTLLPDAGNWRYF